MTLASTIFGLLGGGLLCVALAASVLRFQVLPVGIRYVFVTAVVVAVLSPIGDLSIAGTVRGVTGDLSVSTLALAASAVLARLTGRTMFARRERNALLGLVAGAALFLYPFALGWTPFDPYALGYGSIAFTTVLLLVSLTAWRAGLNLVVLVIAAAAVAYLGGAYESRNLWDYLIDPLAAVYALAVLLPAAVGKLVSQRRQRAPVV